MASQFLKCSLLYLGVPRHQERHLGLLSGMQHAVVACCYCPERRHPRENAEGDRHLTVSSVSLASCSCLLLFRIRPQGLLMHSTEVARPLPLVCRRFSWGLSSSSPGFEKRLRKPRRHLERQQQQRERKTLAWKALRRHGKRAVPKTRRQEMRAEGQEARTSRQSRGDSR